MTSCLSSSWASSSAPAIGVLVQVSDIPVPFDRGVFRFTRAVSGSLFASVLAGAIVGDRARRPSGARHGYGHGRSRVVSYCAAAATRRPLTARRSLEAVLEGRPAVAARSIWLRTSSPRPSMSIAGALAAAFRIPRLPVERAGVIGPTHVPGRRRRTRRRRVRAAAAAPARAHRIVERGVNYDVGTALFGGLTRTPWNPRTSSRSSSAIRDELGCTAVLLVGSEVDRLRRRPRWPPSVGCTCGSSRAPFDADAEGRHRALRHRRRHRRVRARRRRRGRHVTRGRALAVPGRPRSGG